MCAVGRTAADFPAYDRKGRYESISPVQQKTGVFDVGVPATIRGIESTSLRVSLTIRQQLRFEYLSLTQNIRMKTYANTPLSYGSLSLIGLGFMHSLAIIIGLHLCVTKYSAAFNGAFPFFRFVLFESTISIREGVFRTSIRRYSLAMLEL